MNRFKYAAAGAGFAALAARGDEAVELWLANLTCEPTSIEMGGASFQRAQFLDAAALGQSDPLQVPIQPAPVGAVYLDAYGVCRLVGRI